MKKILVLGGTGFLGTQVMHFARESGYDPISLSRKEGTDIRNFDQLSAKLKEIQPDVILNCAGHVGNVHYVTKMAGDVIHDNVQMAVNLYRAVKDTCPQAKIVNPFGNCSYPGAADIQKESEWQNGPVHDSVLAFGFVKRVQHTLAESYRKQYGIKSVNWIVCNPYGPEKHLNIDKMHALNGILTRMMQAQKKGDKQFEIWGTGTPIREWLYIKDAARIMVYSIDNVDEQTYPVNVAKKQGYSIKEIAEIASKALNYPVEFVFKTDMPDGAPVKIMDDTQFRAKYPDFVFTPLDIGIQETIACFKPMIV
jgi:GDP-L-fucose synthase